MRPAPGRQRIAVALIGLCALAGMAAGLSLLLAPSDPGEPSRLGEALLLLVGGPIAGFATGWGLTRRA